MDKVAILKDYHDGMSVTKLGHKYGVSRQRIDQIVHWDKCNCRSLFNYAVKHQKILRQPCEICGQENAQGHHADYSKPFDVRWLCNIHHKEMHTNELYNRNIHHYSDSAITHIKKSMKGMTWKQSVTRTRISKI